MIVDYQYKEEIQKGSKVKYGKNYYRVQDDRGYLHIIIFEDGKRKKIGIDKMIFFEYGSYQDYIFNEWWKLYPDYEMFRTFAENEIKELAA